MTPGSIASWLRPSITSTKDGDADELSSTPVYVKGLARVQRTNGGHAEDTLTKARVLRGMLTSGICDHQEHAICDGKTCHRLKVRRRADRSQCGRSRRSRGSWWWAGPSSAERSSVYDEGGAMILRNRELGQTRISLGNFFCLHEKSLQKENLQKLKFYIVGHKMTY